MTPQTQSFAARPHAGARLLEVEGVFYAEVEHPAAEGLLRVLLHGVSNHEQATLAASVLGATAQPVAEPRTVVL